MKSTTNIFDFYIIKTCNNFLIKNVPNIIFYSHLELEIILSVLEDKYGKHKSIARSQVQGGYITGKSWRANN